MNTKEQGNIGLGKAIAYYTEQLYTVSIPLNDSQKYDLIVDTGACLHRVQVKSSRCLDRHNTNYVIKLSLTGGTRKRGTRELFDNTKSDLVFVYCFNGDMYSIPSKEILTKCKLTLGRKYKNYKI